MDKSNDVSRTLRLDVVAKYFRDTRGLDPFVLDDQGGCSYTCAPWYQKMSAELNSREVAAHGVLQTFFDHEPLHRLPECFAMYWREGRIARPGPPCEQSLEARQRARRRLLAREPAFARRVRERIVATSGRTKHFDRVGVLCWRLHEQAQLLAAEIRDLFAVLGLEQGNAGKSGRARIQQRIDRMRARVRSAQRVASGL